MSVLSNTDSRNLGLRFSVPAFLLGWLAASFQIFLLREFAVHFYGNEMTFGFVLAAWLLWGGLGSLWASRRNVQKAGLARLFYFVLLVSPMCFVGLRFSRFALGILPGEMTGIMPMLIFALVLAFFINFPLGMSFVRAVKMENNLPCVYLWESVGAAAGGLVTYLALIPFFSNWESLGIIGGAAALIIFFTFGKKRFAVPCFATLAVFIGLSFFDFPSQKIFWKPLALVHSRDSLYGKLQIIQTAEQITFYDNGLRIYSHPDLAASEEAVHFALLQNPQAEKLLLVGGGAGGDLGQILKYPRVEVDYVELDPEIIKISKNFLSEDERRALNNPRVHIYYRDGRSFLEKSRRSYDLIILDLPEPATAQINRFYTREFFGRVHEKLKAGGVFSFRVPSAENYISPELQKFLSSMYVTLKKVFPQVAVIPGDSNIFLASDSALATDSESLVRRIQELALETSYVSPGMLAARLNPLRVRALEEKIESGSGYLNTDLAPVSYFFNSVLWSTQFKSLEAKFLTFLTRIPVSRLLDIPLTIFVGFLLLLRFRRKSRGYSLLPFILMGMTTMAVEIMVLIWFQSSYGYVYKQVALLLTTFMAGLALGALRGITRKVYRYAQILLLQFCFLILVLLIKISLNARPPEIIPFAFLFLLGFFGGDFFIVSNKVFFKDTDQAGLGYGLDLLGSFAAAVGLSSILIPLAGLPLLFQYLFLLNSFGLLFLAMKPRAIFS